MESSNRRMSARPISVMSLPFQVGRISLSRIRSTSGHVRVLGLMYRSIHSEAASWALSGWRSCSAAFASAGSIARSRSLTAASASARAAANFRSG